MIHLDYVEAVGGIGAVINDLTRAKINNLNILPNKEMLNLLHVNFNMK